MARWVCLSPFLSLLPCADLSSRRSQQTPDFHDVIPRIFSNVLDHLVLRGRKLMTCDPSGAGELRTVDQYVRARLNLFQQGGGEGPEGFRR